MKAGRKLTTAMVFACVFAASAQWAQAAGSSTPVAAVKALTDGSGSCFSHHPNYYNPTYCPVTPTLYKRMKAIFKYMSRFHGGGYDPVCRCQQAPDNTRYSLYSTDGHFAYVIAYRHYGSNVSPLTFLVKRTADGWRVHDDYCTHHPETDLYRNIQPPACHTNSG